MPTIRATVRQTGHSTSESTVRDHRVTTDRPTDKGGQDAGMMGGELLLAGLGGCFMSNLLAAAAARDVQLTGARADIEGDLESAPSRYGAIRMTVSADTTDPEMLRKLVEIADRGCIVANTLRGSVNLSVTVA